MRECTVQFQTIGNPLFSEQVRMIEKSAYTELSDKLAKAETRVECYKATLKGHLRTISELHASQAREAVLLEALKFYADEMNYSTDDYRGISGEMITRCVLYKDCEERNDIYSYAGRLARLAIAKHAEMKGGKDE